MGWAERSNPKSKWNKDRQTRVDAPISVQTTAKQNFQATNPSKKDEPVVIELSPKSIWEILCRRLKTLNKRHPQSLAPIN